MEKIIVVVRDGCVESVFIDSPEKVELEIVDFDGFLSVAERQEFNDYVNACRATMKEL